MSSALTGREPRLVNRESKGVQRLSLRRLGSLLTVLPSGAISLDAAAGMLESSDFYVRFHGARVLAERGDAPARAVIHHVLASGSAPARASAARQLFRLSWFSAEPMLSRALADEDERVRETAVYALCDLRSLPAYEMLIEALDQDTDNVRAAAAWGLRNCQDSAAVPVLAAVLRADDPEVRGKALEALSANGTPDAVPLVRAALDDAHPDVVYNAVLSWIELRQDRCLSELAGLITGSSGPRLEAILRGLFHASNYLHMEMAVLPVAEVLVTALAGALESDYIPARMAAVWTLAWMHHPRATQTLREAFGREPESEVRAHILRVAGSLMAFTMDDALVREAVHSDDPAVRQAAEQIAWWVGYDVSTTAANPLTKEELAGVVETRRPSRKRKKRR